MLAGLKKLKAKRTYYRTMRLLILLGIVLLFFCIYCIAQGIAQDTNPLNNILSQEQFKTMAVFGVIAIVAMLIINAIVTVCFDKPIKLLYALIPIANNFFIIFAIMGGIGALFCPLDEEEKKKLKGAQSIYNELKDKCKRKQEIETELESLLGVDGFNNYKTSLNGKALSKHSGEIKV